MLREFDFIMDAATFFRTIKPILEEQKIKFIYRQSCIYSVLVKLEGGF
jgi:hypothetical protein